MIMLTPGCRNQFIDCQQATVRIMVLPIMDVNINSNWILELLERAYQLQEFTHEWLHNPEYSEFQPLFTTKDEWAIVNYVMEVFKPFRYCTLWMSKRHMVILHHLITVYNDMFHHTDGVMQALARKKTRWKEYLYFAMKFVQQELFKYYAEVTPKMGVFSFRHISFIISASCDRWGSGTREWISILRTRHCILPNTKRHFWTIWRKNPMPNIDVCRSLNLKAFRATIPSPLQWLDDLVNRSLIHIIWLAMMKNT